MSDTRATIKIGNLILTIHEFGQKDDEVPGIMICAYPAEKIAEYEPINSMFVPFEED